MNSDCDDTSLSTVSPHPIGQPRVFLFLQGHPSKFWPELADALVAEGHRVVRVNLCFADQVFWGRRPAQNFRGRFSAWAGWLRNFLVTEEVTDILYYADRLPYHRVALSVSRMLGVSCWAIEHGYLRPDWLTLERDAMGARSHFPKDWEKIELLASNMQAPNMATLYRHDFTTEAFYEVSYNLLQAFGRPFFPWYWSDKAYWPAIEYLNWIGELAQEPRRKAAAANLQERAASSSWSFNLLAMQLQDDYQIRGSSPYGGLAEFLDESMASFAAHAPDARNLVIKLHPFDNGLERWFGKIRHLAEIHGLTGRVHVIKGGDLGLLIRRSRGVIVVNSTVGIHALRETIPTYCAGQAVYDLSGLTHQGSLDDFWTAPETPDADYFKTFEQALSHIQIKGSFFSPDGRANAIAEICKRFE